MSKELTPEHGVTFNGLVEARFLARLNRFSVLVTIGKRKTIAHIANSGRLRELLLIGNRVWIRFAHREGRKTSYDLVLVDSGGSLVSIDAQLPNALVHHAWITGSLPQFEGYTSLAREVNYGHSRLDMMLKGPMGLCYIETKSVTLVVDGVALFPDAPTIRGRKHVASLKLALMEGHRAAVIFVVQRADATSFSPNIVADPDFGLTLRDAVGAGVEVYSFMCNVSLEGVTILQQMPVRL